MKYFILINVLVLLFSCNTDNKEASSKKKSSEKKEKKIDKKVTASAYLSNYYSAANVPVKEYSYLPGKDTVLEYQSGTTLKISKKSFLDEKGNPISTPVDIQYREFHTTTDILVSGIPMTGDEGGIENTVMSSGMCEFRAYANGNAVKINPEAPVINEMASQRNGTNYNLYYFNENTGKWEEKGKDITKNNMEENGGPTEPEIQEKGKDYFLVSEETGEALKAYHNWIFQPVGNENITQYFATLKNLEITKKAYNKYILKLTQQNNKTNSILCHRVYSPGIGYNKAFAVYEEEFQKALEKNAGKKLIERTFSMQNTGIYNCDSYILDSKGFLEYQFSCKEAGSVSNVQVLDKSLNSCFNFNGSFYVKLNKLHVNTIVINNSDGVCFIIPDSEIKKWKPVIVNQPKCQSFSLTNYEEFKRELEISEK